MWKYSLIVLLFICLVAHADEAARKEAPRQNVGGIADAKDAATVSGIVYFKGEKPEIKPIAEVSGNGFCKEHHKDKLPPRRTFMFGKNGQRDTVQNVLVYVSKGLQEQAFDPPKTPAVLDQV